MKDKYVKSCIKKDLDRLHEIYPRLKAFEVADLYKFLGSIDTYLDYESPLVRAIDFSSLLTDTRTVWRRTEDYVYLRSINSRGRPRKDLNEVLGDIAEMFNPALFCGKKY